VDEPCVEIVEGIADLLAGMLPSGAAVLNLNGETLLLSAGLGLDSVTVLELLLKIETRFGVQFTDDDLSVELFRNLGSLAHAVHRKRQTCVV
jgi:acyl carrier protein